MKSAKSFLAPNPQISLGPFSISHQNFVSSFFLSSYRFHCPYGSGSYLRLNISKPVYETTSRPAHVRQGIYKKKYKYHSDTLSRRNKGTTQPHHFYELNTPSLESISEAKTNL